MHLQMASHFKQQHLICAQLVLLSGVLLCAANIIDPLVFPKQGPYFEMWYVRIIDHHQNVSLGFVFDRVQPPTQNVDSLDPTAASQSQNVDSLDPTAASQSQNESFKIQASETQIYGKQSDSENITQPCCPVFLSLVLSLERNEKLQNPQAFFSSGQYNVSIDGRPVDKDPDDESSPNFQVTIASNFSYVVNKTGNWFTVKVGSHMLTGETAGPVPCCPNGQGPEDWLVKLPLSVHWFVYSLGSTVKTYSYMNSETGEAISGGTEEHKVPVVAYIEKLWGKGIPKAWIWAEGVNPSIGVSFAFTAYIIKEFGKDIKYQLSMYRNTGKNISLGFNPSNSLHSLRHDACGGKVMFIVQSVEYRVTFQVSAPLESFTSVNPANGTTIDGSETSSVAVANITVHKHGLDCTDLIDAQTVYLSACDFGNTYRCKSY